MWSGHRWCHEGSGRSESPSEGTISNSVDAEKVKDDAHACDLPAV